MSCAGRGLSRRAASSEQLGAGCKGEGESNSLFDIGSRRGLLTEAGWGAGDVGCSFYAAISA